MDVHPFALFSFSSAAGVLSHVFFHYFEPESVSQFLVFPISAGVIERYVFSLGAAQILLSGLAWSSSLAISVLFYRVISPFHPLHHVPGPPLAKCTQIAQFWSLYKGRPRVDQWKLHQRYGPVVRIGPNEVSIADTAALSPIFGAKSWAKGKAYSFTASGGAATSETALSSIRDHREHAARRKIWDHAFSIAALKGYQPSIELRVQQLCDQLDRLTGKGPIDLQEWIGYLVFDVMTDLAWGGGGDAVIQGRDPSGAIASLRYSLHLAGMTKALPWFANVVTSLPWVERKTRMFRTFARDMFLKRKENGEAKAGQTGRDVFYHLLGEGTSEGRKLSIGALQADSRQVVTGGADTTVSAITYLFYHLLRQPPYYKQLQSELDRLAASSPDNELQYDTVQRFAVLDAYINEAMRLEPPIPYQNQRIVPQDGVTFSDVFIPGGTHVRTALYTIARSPANFSNPEQFCPERWISARRGSHEAFNPKANIPFIQGPYHCVGRNFAMAEMRWTVARLVERYDMELVPGFDQLGFESCIEDRSVLEIESSLDVRVRVRKHDQS
ncbi:uncharacterized protein PV09_08544 [Verruconis gallopava]|uniref:Cytochrome P450 n=1 Tax=Verruconis gallopava TaxID=253628 RepID=A0A0D1ZZM3_9PEZI|nr:uncharacterized protein PV09_08544 [Verruconis gallopava]KIV99877.1 hypothetical protein PV09_08544 [Verruconis gallopava]